MLVEPTGSPAVLKVATPVASSAADTGGAPPAVKLTEPVGVPVASNAVTVAVNVTF